MITFITRQWRYFWRIYIKYDVVYGVRLKWANVSKFIRSRWGYFKAVYIEHKMYKINYANGDAIGKPIRISFPSEISTLRAINKRLAQLTYIEGSIANSYRTISCQKRIGQITVHFQPYRS